MMLQKMSFVVFFFNDTATTEIYTLSLHDALPISRASRREQPHPFDQRGRWAWHNHVPERLGHYLAVPEEIDCLDQGQRRAGHANAARGRQSCAAGSSRLARQLLALVSDALLHGGVEPLPVLVRQIAKRDPSRAGLGIATTPAAS